MGGTTAVGADRTRATLTGDEVVAARELLGRVDATFDAQVAGQAGVRRALLATMLAEGHLLLESVPGLAKTLAASTLAASVRAIFARIQCTPDLLPSDILGTQVYDPHTHTFDTHLGPVHAHVVLLDEINRASAKTQSAMLEAMQERQTSIAGVVHPLPSPFMVLATQNPIEEEGTYVLPAAQLDRFLLKEVVDYPSTSAEVAVLDRFEAGTLGPHAEPVEPVMDVEDVVRLQRLTERVYVDGAIKDYIVRLVSATRGGFDTARSARLLNHQEDSSARRLNHREDGFDSARSARRLNHRDGFDKLNQREWHHLVETGASPRASIAFFQVSRALALMEGRNHVLPEDVHAMRHGVLRHRLHLTFEAMADRVAPEEIIDAVFAAVPAP